MTKDIVVIDIDGCLNHYPSPLKMWAEVLLNLDTSESGEAIKEENDFDLLKKTYRHSKILSFYLPKEGASKALSKIKKGGYSITLLTARNPKKNPRIKGVTRNWLLKYNIPFDSIIFTKDKGSYIRKNEKRIVMAVEDHPRILNSFGKLRTELVVFKNDLNRDIHLPNVHAVSSWKEIDSLFESLVAN